VLIDRRAIQVAPRIALLDRATDVPHDGDPRLELSKAVAKMAPAPDGRASETGAGFVPNGQGRYDHSVLHEVG
jgi:hypothetical protein